MTLDRIEEIKAVARQHPGHKSTEIINELVQAIEETNRLYVLAIESAFSGSQRLKSGYALSQLKNLVYRETASPVT